MRKQFTILLLVALMLPTGMLAQTIAKAPRATVIDIQKRPKPKTLLQEYDQDSVGSKSWFVADDLYDYTIRAHSDTAQSRYAFDDHPFINSVRAAYADHRPLVLSPDIVWLVIEQGFAIHVAHNAEALRSKIVDFDGKMTLRLTCRQGLIDMPAKEWEPYFGQFTDSIAQYAGRDLANTLICNFTTTTPTALVASQVSTMAALKSYFNYVMDEGCGIPTVTLEGTPEDWQKLVEKAHALRQYGLDWWMDELEPVLQKMARAAAGEVDRDFWKAIYKNYGLDYEEGCGIVAKEKINGWVVKFYPYNNRGDRMNLTEMDDELTEHLPKELSYAPLEYKEWGKPGMRHLTVFGGLQGIEQDHTTFAIKPHIVWFVAEKVEEE